MDTILNTGIAPLRSKADDLKQEVAQLEAELKGIDAAITAFELLLRSQLINEIIEEQELSVLYKQKQRAKKESRKEQQRRGKNFKETVLPQRPVPGPAAEDAEDAPPAGDPAMRKRLYREAMVQVHPDKYANHAETVNLASDATMRLIDLYQRGSIRELVEFHAYIMSGSALNLPQVPQSAAGECAAETYLLSLAEKLRKEIAAMKSRHLYVVMLRYPDQNAYLAELKLFYADRIAKLRKRTRKMQREVPAG